MKVKQVLAAILTGAAVTVFGATNVPEMVIQLRTPFNAKVVTPEVVEAIATNAAEKVVEVDVPPMVDNKIEGSVANGSISNTVHAAEVRVTEKIETVQSNVSTVATNVEAIAEQVTDLGSQMSDVPGAITAALEIADTNAQAKASAAQAAAEARVDALLNEGGAVSNNTAAISAEKTERVSQFETLYRSISQNSRGIGTNTTAIADHKTEVTGQINDLKSKIDRIYKVRGSVDTKLALHTKTPMAEAGDVWYVKSEASGYVCGIDNNNVKSWTKLDPIIDMSVYKTGDEIAQMIGSGIGPVSNDVETIKGQLADLPSGSTVVAELATKRDKDDLKIYRAKKDIWSWSSTDPNCPSDFLDLASKYALKLTHHPKAGDAGDWGNAIIYWPTGVRKYVCDLTAGADTNTELDIWYTVCDEFGEFTDTRFKVRATRTSATDGTLVPITAAESGLVDRQEAASKLNDGALRKTVNWFKDILKSFLVDDREVTLGGGATNVNHMEAVTINGCERYPSYTYGFSNVNIGIDNITGYGDDGLGGVIQTDGSFKTNAYYSTVIGTSSSAKYRHSYVFGSQAHASAPNTFVIGYGATATDADSTIIGFGVRPTPDKKFSTRAEMLTWFKSFADYTAATNAIPFADYMITITNDTIEARIPESYNGDYYVKSIRDSKHTTYGWVELYQDAPHDTRDEYIRGRHNWDYGKTHGKGTINFVAKGADGTNPGLSALWINDVCFDQFLGIGIGYPVWKPQYDKGVWKDPVLSQADCTVAIGVNAKATETAKSSQSVAIGRDALATGSATVALGPNTFTEGAQSIAIGWRANAVGAHSISIGSAKKSGEDYYKDGAINPNSDLNLAEGDFSIAVGYNAKATQKDSTAIGDYAAAKAVGAVQLGHGTNDVANTLKFQDVTIVKDGHVVGSVPDPEVIDLPEVTEEMEIEVKPGSITTILPTTGEMGPGTEMSVSCKGLRNYTIYLPNEEKLRVGLPILFVSEIPSATKVVFEGDKTATRLPIRFNMEQPYDGLVVVKPTIFDDGSDWMPVIEGCNLVFELDATAGYSIKTVDTDATKRSLFGKNLHAATNYVIRYEKAEAVGGGTIELPLMEKSATTQFMSRTYYGYAGSIDLKLENDQQPKIDGGTVTYSIIYKTVNGEAAVFTKTVDLEVKE